MNFLVIATILCRRIPLRFDVVLGPASRGLAALSRRVVPSMDLFVQTCLVEAVVVADRKGVSTSSVRVKNFLRTSP